MTYTKERTILNELSTEEDYNEKITPNICILCDKYIYGTAKPKWIKKDVIMKHSHRLDINRWKSVSGVSEINPILRQQYLFPEIGFEQLLLSPRSRKNDDNCFLSCETCFHSLRNDYVQSVPPKYPTVP